MGALSWHFVTRIYTQPILWILWQDCRTRWEPSLSILVTRIYTQHFSVNPLAGELSDYNWDSAMRHTEAGWPVTLKMTWTATCQCCMVKDSQPGGRWKEHIDVFENKTGGALSRHLWWPQFKLLYSITSDRIAGQDGSLVTAFWWPEFIHSI